MDDFLVFDENKVVIEFEDIAKKMLKYYWYQIFFFNLKQSSNIKKPSVIYRVVSDIIEQYKINHK